MARLNRVIMSLLAAFICTVAFGQTTTGWRGDGSGRFPKATPPTTWGPDKNVAWKTELPGNGNASPIVVGEKLFLCADPSTLICLNRADGKILWKKSNEYLDMHPPEEHAKIKEEMQKGAELKKKIGAIQGKWRGYDKRLQRLKSQEEVDKLLEALKVQLAENIKLKAELSELEYGTKYDRPRTHGVTGYSTPTPVSDGKLVFALFGNGVATCYDLDGNRKWIKVVGKPTHGWGHSSSPLLAGDIFVAHIGPQMVGLTAATGEEAWTLKNAASWGSDILVKVGDQDIIVCANGTFVRPKDGGAVGSARYGLAYNAPVHNEGVLYFIQQGGRAVKLPDQVGEKLEVKTLWSTKPANDRYYASPVYHDGLIYTIGRAGQFSMIDAKDGKVIHAQTFKLGGTAYPSLAVGGNRIYISSDSGKTVVIEAGREFKQVALNTLAPFRSCPVFDGKRMYIRALASGRGDKAKPAMLYCIAE